MTSGQIGKIVKFKGKDTLTIILNNGTRLELFEGQKPQYKQELVQIDGKAKIAQIIGNVEQSLVAALPIEDE